MLALLQLCFCVCVALIVFLEFVVVVSHMIHVVEVSQEPMMGVVAVLSQLMGRAVVLVVFVWEEESGVV